MTGAGLEPPPTTDIPIVWLPWPFPCPPLSCPLLKDTEGTGWLPPAPPGAVVAGFAGLPPLAGTEGEGEPPAAGGITGDEAPTAGG